MNPVIVKDVKIGEGIPKICVPIVGVTEEEIIQEAEGFAKIPADLAEWRADWYEQAFHVESVKEMLRKLRGALNRVPLLLTFRTAKEGGEKYIEPEEYAAWLKAAVKTGCVDLIDVEMFAGDDYVTGIIETAHQYGVKVIASNHDFQGTPKKEELVNRLCRMQELGADICKIAVMPRSAADVLTLLAATEEMYREYADRPIITMSMSGMGVPSRLCGELFGSAVTFGAAKKASAPGQMEVGDLAQILSLLHDSMV